MNRNQFFWNNEEIEQQYLDYRSCLIALVDSPGERFSGPRMQAKQTQ